MARTKLSLVAPSKAIDPTLDALFASSSGPVVAPSKGRYAELLSNKEPRVVELRGESDPAVEPSDDEVEEGEDADSLSELEDDEEGDADDHEAEDEEEETGSDASEQPTANLRKERKRKRRDEHDDLEGKYMRKLADEEEKEDRQEKRRKGEAGEALEIPAPQGSEDAEAKEDEEDDEDETPLVHESLQKPEAHGDIELDKANRTLFLGNVSIEVVTSPKAKKLLISHLETPLSELDSSTGPHKIESIRFRSTPFSTGAKPKRAAFITKSVMSATTKSTNAYAVYSTPLASRTALRALNGSVVLDRHLRVDSVAHPAAVDNRRCVFVGNLGFVDDETVVNTNAEGETVTKKRHKVPADTEEGLWRIFGEHAGKVESVRVPRDDKTRVGKGFAYVQFYDENDVESALLLNEKKFPPMLPRPLRVSRAKDPRKTALAMERTSKARLTAPKIADGKRKSTGYVPKITPEQQSQAGRAGKLFGHAAAAKRQRELRGDRQKPREHREPRDRGDKPRENGDGIKPPEQFIFEGRRASAKDGKPKDLKFGKTKGKKGPVKTRTKGRGARRAAEWRKSKTS
ncbi:putative RNA recognition domain-containing protein [Rosellinia necatrix]|uniref:Nucleolar protein 12 n=1 Tax=Rosellinia necatrix TaxID=77044 RepID=A0A1W2TB18_ROSNE|nr:putative RNA recognition domain-containing protein [Rosellinia necatrix]